MNVLARQKKSHAVLVMAGFALAAVTAWHAAVMSSRVDRSPLALMLFPGEPVALARVQALTIAKAIEDKGSARSAVEPLKTSLRHLALNSQALRLLAIAKGEKVEDAPDYQLIRLAHKVTRRDLGTQILRIREGGEKGDIKLVLEAYDTALRTQRQSWDILFPKLAVAAEIPQAQPYFREILADNPIWLSDFLTFAISQTKRPELLYRSVFESGRIEQIARKDDLVVAIVSRLVATGQLGLARKASIESNMVDPSILTTPALNAKSVGRDDNVLKWQMTDSSGIGAQVLGNEILSVFADTGRKGIAASKVLYLTPGSYILGARIVEKGTTENGSISWVLTCLGNPSGPSRIGKLETLPSRDNSAPKWAMTVPAGCPAVLLSLELYGGERAGGAEFNLQDLALAKAL